MYSPSQALYAICKERHGANLVLGPDHGGRIAPAVGQARPLDFTPIPKDVHDAQLLTVALLLVGAIGTRTPRGVGPSCSASLLSWFPTAWLQRPAPWEFTVRRRTTHSITTFYTCLPAPSMPLCDTVVNKVDNSAYFDCG